MRQRKVFVLSYLPIRKSFSAITLPPWGIFIRKSWWCAVRYTRRAKLLRHEYVHWRQYQDRGVFKYYFDYLVFAWHYGYQNHPMELEARGDKWQSM